MDRNTVRLRLPRSLSLPLDADCNLAVIIHDKRTSVTYSIDGKIIDSTIPNDNPEVREVVISVN